MPETKFEMSYAEFVQKVRELLPGDTCGGIEEDEQGRLVINTNLQLRRNDPDPTIRRNYDLVIDCNNEDFVEE